MALPSRKAKRQSSEKQGLAVLWRACGWVCLLAMLLFMTVKGTYAYMIGSGSVSTTLASASFGSLMTLSPDPAALNFSGRVGDSFSGAITVTSRASVPLSISAHWDGPAPGGAAVTLTSGTIDPGDSVQVTVSGTFGSSGQGSVRISIGQNFDWITFPVQVTALSWPISQFITVKQEESHFHGAEFANLKVAEISQVTGQPAIPLQIQASQQPEIESTSSVSTDGTAIYISHAPLEKGAATYVTLTISSSAPYVIGTQTITFELANPADKEVTEGESHEDASQGP